jgi:hypothetical protein
MASENEVAVLIAILREAVASALNEKKEAVSIELKDLAKVGQAYTILASFKVSPFFITRTGSVFAALLKTEKGFEITSLKIDERGL